jgi:hypothetical protein
MADIFEANSIGPLCIVVSRAEVESGDIEPAMSTLRRLTESTETAKLFMENVDIGFHGYDHDRRELFEIDEVRDYVYKLDEQFPYWLFFLSKNHLGLQCLMFCKLLPYLTDEAKLRLHPQQLEELLTNRWGPALWHIGAFAGLSDEEQLAIANRAITYFQSGRLLD